MHQHLRKSKNSYENLDTKDIRDNKKFPFFKQSKIKHLYYTE